MSKSASNAAFHRKIPLRQQMARILAGLLVIGIATDAMAQERPPASVALAPVISREFTDRQSFVGSIRPLKTSSVGSAVDGRVAEFPVNEGDRVTKGQALAQLLTETISAQLEAAKAQQNLREAELQELENGTRKEELERTKARMQAAQATREYAVNRLKRFEQLFEQGRTITVDQREEAQSLADRQIQTYQEAAAEYALAVAGPRAETILQAQARVAEQAQMVKQLSDQLRKHTMISPFDGYVTAEFTEVGQWVSRGELVATVAYLDEVHVVVPVPENYITYVEPGAEAQVRIPALKNRTFPGVVDQIVPQADVRSRTFPVQVRVKNEMMEGRPLIKSGMVAYASLPSSPRQELLLVPKDAIKLGGPQPLVLVVEKAEVDPENPDAVLDVPSFNFKMVPVELGTSHGSVVAVRGPLKAGQYVIAEGNERLIPGTKIQALRVISTDELMNSKDSSQAAAN